MRPLRLAAEGTPLVHWRAQDWPEQELDWIVSPSDALAQALLCQPHEQAVACLDSMLALDVITEAEWSEIRDTLPVRLWRLDEVRDARAGSGNETVARLRFGAAGFSVEPQVFIPGIGTVDLVVDGVVIVEVDSETFHSDAEQRRRDRRRTLLAQAYRIPTLRVGSEDFGDEHWTLVVSALHQQVADARRLQRDHRPLAWG